MTIECRTANIFFPGRVLRRRILPPGSEETLYSMRMKTEPWSVLEEKIIVISPDQIRSVTEMGENRQVVKIISMIAINKANLRSTPTKWNGNLRKIYWVPTKE